MIEHPATARRIAWRLCDTFLGENQADAAAIEELAELLRSSELDINQAVGTILKSQAFFAEANLGSRVRSPVDFVVATVRALELFDPPPSTLILAETLAKLGQDLFDPPNVFGWPGGRSWINSRSVLGRSHFALELLQGKLYHGGTTIGTLRLAKKYDAAGSTESQARFFSRPLMGQEPDPAIVQQMAKQLSAKPDEKEHIASTIVSMILTQPAIHLG